MAPDSLLAIALLAGLAVLVAAGTAWAWDRPHGWRAWIVRSLAGLLCLLSTAGVAGLIANRALGFYGSWGELAGLGPAAAVPGLSTVTTSTSGSRVVTFMVAGTASHIRLRAYAYLPPGYDAAVAHRQRLPAIEALDGYPGSPHTWLSTLDATTILDTEITSGRMAPTVVVFPYQSSSSTHDTECIDAVGGMAMDTFLSVDVPATVVRLFRVRRSAAAWGVLGYSTGGFCAVNLALRHPERYAAAVSFSGNLAPYTDAATGDLFHGNTTVANLNNPLWRITHTKLAPLAVYLAAGLNDRNSTADLQRFAALARPPLRVTTAALPSTGHTMAAWRAFQAPAYDWASSWLAGPAVE